MRKLAVVAPLVSIGAFCLMEVGRAQFGRGVGDFSTTGGDAQRSSWVRTDPKISRESLQKPGFQFLWKVKLNNQARELNALTPASLLTGYIGYRGFRSLAFVGGSADKVFAMDTDLGRMEWQKSLTGTTAPAGNSLTCPGGMTAAVTRPVGVAFAPAGFGGGRGRGGAAKGGVGEPGEGAVTLQQIAGRNAQAAFPVPPAPNAPGGRRGAAPRGGGGFGRMPSFLHAISSDGMLHSMYVSNGEEPKPALKFLPPNANAKGLIVVENVAYAATSGGCGGAPNALWSLDLTSGQVESWQAPGGGIGGSDGPAFGPDGTLYTATDAGELVAIEAKTLKVKDIYKGGQGFQSSPVVFQFKDKTMIAVAAKDGRIHVVDSRAFGGPGLQSTASNGAPDSSAGSLATWQDAAGTRFLLTTTASGIAALKLVDQGGTPALKPAWTSRDLVSPLAPLIINGVVFAASGGEFRSTGDTLTAAQRAQRSTPAVLYALDGATGKELWNSGKTMTSFVHDGGISGGGSQVYLGTHDGVFYAFGFPIEH
jgi:outer membrane protein assembly factor BamB